MATTFTIPLTTLTAGNDLTTPAQAVGTNTHFFLSIDSNVGATPLESLSGPAVTLAVDYSFDGGSTWPPPSDSQTIGGGIIRKRDGSVNTVRAWGSTFLTGTTHIRGRIHPIQGLTTSGSLTLS